MVAAIYARKSTEQHVAEDAKSVTTQIETARAYAARKGWTVDDDYVYVDDGISGAEFERRPGFTRLMAALKPRPPFDVLIMSESSRLGRESMETGYALKQLMMAKVRVFFSFDDQECSFDDPMYKLQFSMVQVFDEMERARSSQRVTASFLNKARRGEVCGGKVFGFDNVPVTVDGRKSHVRFEPNPEQAAIVREIFGRFAKGQGLKQIAHALNEQGAACPRAQRGRPSAWGPSTIRAILHRPLYRGEYVYNATKKRDAWGKQKIRRRDASELIRHEMPHLRIIDEPLWREVHSRIERESERYLRTPTGQVLSRPARHAKYLLTGLVQCTCGAGLEAFWPSRRTFSRPGRPRVYLCAAHRRKGARACAHGFEMWVEDANTAIVESVGQLLQPDVVDEIIERTIERYAGSGRDTRVAALEAEEVKLRAEIGNLVAAIATGGAELRSLTDEIRRRELRVSEIEHELAALKLRESGFNRGRLDGTLRQRMKEWRRLLQKRQEQGRQVLQKLIVGRLVFTPREDGFIAYHGTGTLKGLLFDGQIPSIHQWRPRTDLNRRPRA